LRRVAQIIQLNREDEAAYIRYHEQVWPTVLATIASCNITNYSIFLRDGLLFSYFEYYGNNYAEDMSKMSACPDTQRWWSIMDPMQSPMADALPGEKWSEMREVFHFDSAAMKDLENG
jgi:L-rhamnose mutarotase